MKIWVVFRWVGWEDGAWNVVAAHRSPKGADETVRKLVAQHKLQDEDWKIEVFILED